MTAITVLGAGVVGSTYASLLARAGHRVTVVARGGRLAALQREGLRVRLDEEVLAAEVEVAGSLQEAPSDVLLVAVRGDQLEATLPDLARTHARCVLMFANPLGLRDTVDQRLGAARLVWCFSGIGGGIDGDGVTAHRVAQQSTVVQDGRPQSTLARELLTAADARTRVEPDMDSWLATHTVFVAAMAAVILQTDPRGYRARLRVARRLVGAVHEGFTALEAKGTRITPGNLRAIFGRVPSPIATAYWAHQLARPVVTVSMAPHARATRGTEQRAVARHALELVGPRAPRFRTLVAPIA